MESEENCLNSEIYREDILLCKAILNFYDLFYKYHFISFTL